MKNRRRCVSTRSLVVERVWASCSRDRLGASHLRGAVVAQRPRDDHPAAEDRAMAEALRASSGERWALIAIALLGVAGGPGGLNIYDLRLREVMQRGVMRGWPSAGGGRRPREASRHPARDARDRSGRCPRGSGASRRRRPGDGGGVRRSRPSSRGAGIATLSRGPTVARSRSVGSWACHRGRDNPSCRYPGSRVAPPATRAAPTDAAISCGTRRGGAGVLRVRPAAASRGCPVSSPADLGGREDGGLTFSPGTRRGRRRPARHRGGQPRGAVVREPTAGRCSQPRSGARADGQ